jgi:hypothetical protein
MLVRQDALNGDQALEREATTAIDQSRNNEHASETATNNQIHATKTA